MEGVMVSAAMGVMNSLLTKLAALLGEEYKLKKSVRRDIGFLKDELSSMNALLEKLADAEELDSQQKEWRSQVREMAYDIEDCIDDYMHWVQQDPNKSNGVKGFFRGMIDKAKKLGPCHGISEQIKELKIRIVQASERRDRYKLDAVPGSSSASVVPIDPRLPALYAEASSLVGIDGPRDELVKMVDDGEQQMKVVSIVGFGGLGKTTLANQIYKQVDSQFDCGAFVSVSQKPDVRKILRTILHQVKKQEDNGPQTWEENRLIQELREFLKDKRYFIIIDDIWCTQHWKIIKCALPENACGSRILVTTRNLNVAKSCCSRLHDAYQLRPLSGADSTSLFFRRVFGSKDECPLKLKQVSNEIIRKCGGIPLAIIAMASLLTNKTDATEEWLIVLRSIGSGLEKNSHVEEMKKILSLSYNDLSHQLRTCLLYLSMYPEDYIIQRDRLVRRWIAEGFVKNDGVRNLREKGESYFNELINRSMIQPVDIQYDGQANGCRVHDMILDFIMSKAVEENFITSVDDQSQRLVSQYKIRRLSLDFRGQENVGMMPPLDTSPVRSLGTFGSCVVMNRISDFLALRVLDIEDYNSKCHDLTNIGNLIQLRYLRIHGYDLTHLSEQIGELQYLETLDIERTGVTELPASIIKLRRLKWLRCSISKLPDGLGNMQSLEELSEVHLYDNCSMNSLRELGSLSKLRTLVVLWGISKKSNVVAYGEILALSLGKLISSNIRQLSVSQWVRAYFMRDMPVIGSMQLYSWSTPSHLVRELDLLCFVFLGIPGWMTSLSNLTKLRITVNQVTQEMLDILGDMPALLDLFLRLKPVEEPKERVVIPNNNFKCLKILEMRHWATAVTFEAGCMPKLETLHVIERAREVQTACYGTHYCSGVHHCSALRDVEIWIDCEGMGEEERKAVVDAIRDTASKIPNHPIPKIHRY